MQTLYRKPLNPVGSITLCCALALAFCAMRAVGTLGPANLRWLLPVGFCIMTLLPWILLKADGRKKIGFRKARNSIDAPIAAIYGAAAAALIFLLGFLLYKDGSDNWYVSIAGNYRSIMDTSQMSFWMLNLIFTTPALIFSPIGEEIFFRGILPSTLQQRLSSRSSTAIECGLFGLVHLFHHGISRTDAGIAFLPVSGTLWALQMTGVAFLFAWLRKRSGSLYIAIIGHATFNLTMNLIIFSFLW